MMSGYFISLFLSTFVLEDVALASAIALMAQNKISFFEAFLCCFLGISVGDLGLYGFGWIGSRFQLKSKLLNRLRHSQVLTYSIVASRMIPGTRLPTYVAAGLLRYPFWKFLALTVASVAVWVFGALLAGRSLRSLFMDHWIPLVLIFLLGLHLLKTVFPQLLDPWDRKALFHSWRQWTHFEFWPAWFFYIPIVPTYIYLSLKHKSFLTPFYASPLLANGGLIGESKWDYLQHLDPKNKTTLPSHFISKNLDFNQTRQILNQNEITYPFILKPDVGQRGFGVRIIRNDYDLTEYLLLSDFDRIIQKLSLLPNEAGIFYIREPHEQRGRLFSFTDKKFPFVVGDGITRLGDLILKDPRARIMASVYFNRHREALDSLPAIGDRYFLSECGNHCQGAIFLNGESMITDSLTAQIDRVAKEIPRFYFGRFDVRYLDADSLMRGEQFEIVEVNGSGAEATHIWDPSTRLFDAYRVLFRQWAILFKIGAEVKKSSQKSSPVNLFVFFKECAKVVLRKERLSVSS